MTRKLVLGVVLAVGAVAVAATARPCYCGYKANSVSTLTAGKCLRHPNGALKGCHVLYEGTEKDEYVCKCCGRKTPELRTLEPREADDPRARQGALGGQARVVCDVPAGSRHERASVERKRDERNSAYTWSGDLAGMVPSQRFNMYYAS